MASGPSAPKQRVMHDDRLGFRLNEQTKLLIEHAAQLDRRKVSDFCVKALTEAAQETIARYETLRLTDAERAAFFDILIKPPEPNDRLKRAVTEARRRVAS